MRIEATGSRSLNSMVCSLLNVKFDRQIFGLCCLNLGLNQICLRFQTSLLTLLHPIGWILGRWSFPWGGLVGMRFELGLVSLLDWLLNFGL
jgi:hypothetical protein